MKLDLKTILLTLSLVLNALGGSSIVPPVIAPAAPAPVPCAG